MKPNRQETSSLETQYAEFFHPIPVLNEWSVTRSLAQPNPLRTVPSIVTYGVYEHPIMGRLEDPLSAELE